MAEASSNFWHAELLASPTVIWQRYGQSTTQSTVCLSAIAEFLASRNSTIVECDTLQAYAGAAGPPASDGGLYGIFNFKHHGLRMELTYGSVGGLMGSPISSIMANSARPNVL